MTLGDPRTADPCSLIDKTALGRHGAIVVDPDNVSFSGCRAAITTPGGSALALFVEFAVPPASTDTVGPPQRVGAILLDRLRPSATVCARDLLLPDGNIVSVYAQRFAAGPDDLCAIADTAATSTAAVLNARGPGVREPLDATSPLAGIDACSLLGAADVATVPGTRSPGAPGFGRWSCSWGRPTHLSVFVNYYRGQPPTPGGPTTVDIAGRTAATAPAVAQCRVEFVQRRYTGSLGERADLVQVTVYGAAGNDSVCAQATALATTAARTLPPPT